MALPDPPHDPPEEVAPRPARDRLWPFRPADRGRRLNEHVREEAPAPELDVVRLARLIRAPRRDGSGEGP